jgi:hypothetical protein
MKRTRHNNQKALDVALSLKLAKRAVIHNATLVSHPESVKKIAKYLRQTCHGVHVDGKDVYNGEDFDLTVEEQARLVIERSVFI